MNDFATIMEEKCMNFAIRVVNLCKFLNEEKREFRMSDQLFRSAASIGANFAEAQCGISKNDFVAKIYVSQKECNESLYWLKLLYKTGYLNQKQFDSIFNDCEELKKLFVTITKTTRKNQNL